MGIFSRVPEVRIFHDERYVMPDYIPDVLPYRDKEINELVFALQPIVRGRKPEHVVMVGPPGTGKTSTAHYVLRHLEQETKKATTFFINCWETPTRHGILSKLVMHYGAFAPRRGIATDELIEELASTMRQDGRTLVLVLDEADRLSVEGESDILYEFVRGKELFGVDIGLILITNDIAFVGNLEPRIRSSLTPKEIRFSGYTPDQLRSILRERAKKAFVSGSYTDDVIGLCVAYAVKSGGDCRIAITTLWRAGRNAENAGRTMITPDDVRAAYSDAAREKERIHAQQLQQEERELLSRISEKKEGWLSGELQKTLGYDERTLRNYIAHLETLGFVVTERVRVGKGWSRRITRKNVDNEGKER